MLRPSGVIAIWRTSPLSILCRATCGTMACLVRNDGFCLTTAGATGMVSDHEVSLSLAHVRQPKSKGGGHGYVFLRSGGSVDYSRALVDVRGLQLHRRARVGGQRQSVV